MKELNLKEMEMANGGQAIDEVTAFLRKIFQPKPTIVTTDVPKSMARLGRK